MDALAGFHAGSWGYLTFATMFLIVTRFLALGPYPWSPWSDCRAQIRQEGGEGGPLSLIAQPHRQIHPGQRSIPWGVTPIR
jgi:hypothetical protein